MKLPTRRNCPKWKFVVLKELKPLLIQKSKTIREMVELLFPRTLSEDMKDVFRLPRGLGLRGVIVLRFVTFYIMYNTSDLRICQPLEPIFVQDVQNVV